jgi:hypothetical protein
MAERLLARFGPSALTPQGQGALNRVWRSSTASTVSLGKKIYETKVVGKICFSVSGSYFWAHNPDLEGPGPHVLLEPWSIIFRLSLLNKRCSTLGLTYLATFALTIHFIILI